PCIRRFPYTTLFRSGGEVVDTGGGPLVVVRREYPLSHRHGRLALGDALDVAVPALELLAPLGAPSDPRGLLFLDTETAGLAGGRGRDAFLDGADVLGEGQED